MAKQEPQKQFKVNDDPGRVSRCGNFVRMKNGSTFKRTVLPSVASNNLAITPDEIDLDGATIKEVDK